MNVRISVALVVNCKICTHSFRNEALQTEISYQINLLVTGYLHRQSCINVLCGLAVLSFFCLLNRIPKNSTFHKFRRSIRREQDFLMYNFFLLSVIVGNTVIAVFNFLARNVCRLCNRTCIFTAAYNLYIKMINCNTQHLLVIISFVSFLSLNLRECYTLS